MAGVFTFVTTAPAPITTPSPIVKPPFFGEITIADPPNQQSLPMVMGWANSGPAQMGRSTVRIIAVLNVSAHSTLNSHATLRHRDAKCFAGCNRCNPSFYFVHSRAYCKVDSAYARDGPGQHRRTLRPIAYVRLQRVSGCVQLQCKTPQREHEPVGAVTLREKRKR